MIFFDYMKKIVYTSYLRGFGVCFGCFGSIGPPKYPNFTRTKHFVLSLALLKSTGFLCEKFLGRERTLLQVPRVALVLRVLVEAFMLDEYQYGTKVGGLHARYVCDALTYFAWPAFLPLGVATVDATGTGDASHAHLRIQVVSKAFAARVARGRARLAAIAAPKREGPPDAGKEVRFAAAAAAAAPAEAPGGGDDRWET